MDSPRLKEEYFLYLAIGVGSVIILVANGYLNSFILYNTSSNVLMIYHCKTESQCFRFDRKQKLFRTTILYNGSTQNRWYVEDISTGNRILGAIEITRTNYPILKPWKRILPSGETVDASEMNLELWNYSTCDKSEQMHATISTLVALYHRLSLGFADEIFLKKIQDCSDIFTSYNMIGADQGNWVQMITKSLLICDTFLLKKQYAQASLCLKNTMSTPFWDAEIATEKKDDNDVVLTTALLLRVVKFQLLSGESPTSLWNSMQIAQSISPILQRIDQASYDYYNRQFSLLDNLFAFYFQNYWRTPQFLTVSPEELQCVESLKDFIEAELFGWSLAENYFMKLYTITQMMKDYEEKRIPVFSLFSSMANYALQSGAVEQAASFLVSGVIHSSADLHKRELLLRNIREISKERNSAWKGSRDIRGTCGTSSNSLVPYAFQLQYLMTVDADSRHFILSESEAFQSFLTVLTQVTMPVILSAGSNVTWWAEALMLRIIVIETIESLTEICRRTTPLCHLNIHHRGSGVRGLFLAAYQGISLIPRSELSVPAEILQQHSLKLADTTLSTAYYTLLQSITLGNEILHPFSSTGRNMPLFEHISNPIISKDSYQPISIVFVCYSISRHSVGRLLAKLIRHLVTLRTRDGLPTFAVYILTDKLHPSEDEQAKIQANSDTKANKVGNADDEIFLDIASLFTIESGKWLTLPAFDFGPNHFTSLFQFIRAKNVHNQGLFDIAVFSDLLMQASQCIWAHEIRIAHQQVLFWGHPQTSGMIHTMDYYITSASFESSLSHKDQARSAQFIEQLVVFDTLSFVLFDAEEIATTLPGETAKFQITSKALTDYSTTSAKHKFLWWLRNHSESLASSSSDADILKDQSQYDNVRLYGSIQTLMKHHPLLDEVLYQLLLQDPNAIVVLLKSGDGQAHWFLRFQMRLYQYFITQYQHQQQDSATKTTTNSTTVGISTVDAVLSRIRWISPLPHRQYARVVCHMDVNLDPFIFGGGVTLCDGIGGRCPVMGEEENSNSNGGEGKSAVFQSVGFVTAGDLQTVHRIGAGIATHIADNTLAVDVSSSSFSQSQDDITNSHKHSSNSKIGMIINNYVREAIRLAKETQNRRSTILKEVFHKESGNVESNASVVQDWHIRRAKIDQLIYRNQEVLNEYTLFFQRLAAI